MSETTHAASATHKVMEDEAAALEQKQQELPSSAAASASAGPQPPPPLAVPAASARAQRVARRAQMRGDEPEPDPAEIERKRSEALQSKASARAAAQEARRAAALAAQTALWRSFGPAQKLFADGIASCLGFLDLKDVLAAARACKSWREGAKTIRTLGSAEVRDAMVRGLIPPMLASPFRHLVSALTDELTWRELERGARITIQSTARFDWTRQRLDSAFQQLSGLTSLTLCIDITKIRGMAPIVYPPRLQQLTLSIGCHRKGPEYMWSCAPLLRGLSLCLSLRGLTLRFLDRNQFQFDLTVLLGLPVFCEFGLEVFGFLMIGPSLLRMINRLPLQSLSFVNINDNVIACEDEDLDFVIPLLQEPNPLPQVTRLNVSPFCWYQNEIELSRLPSLTELKPDTISLDVLPQLASLPRLTCLHLPLENASDFYDDYRDDIKVADIMDEHKRIRASAVLPHLQSLTALTELHIKGVTFTKEDFAALCNVHHGLQILQLDRVAVASLEGLGTLAALREFVLTLWPPPEWRSQEHAEVADVVEHVAQCKALVKLALNNMSPALSDADQLALKPPSALLPLLQSFKYSSR